MSTTLHEWASQGMNQNQGQTFAQEITSIQGLKAFLSTLPYWCDKHQTGVVLQIVCEPQSGGVGIDLAFGKNSLPLSSAHEFLDLLKEHNHLNELQLVIEKMKNLGIDPSVINILVDEANTLAKKIKDNF